MSVIQTIRDKAAIIVFVFIAISLIAFVLQDAFVGNQRSRAVERDILKVEDLVISVEEFDPVLEYQKTRTFKERAATISSQEKYKLIDELWPSYKSSIVFQNIATKSNLIATSVDLEENLFGKSVTPEIKKVFSDSKTGKFDPQKIKNYLNSLKTTNNKEEKDNFNKSVIIPLIKSIQSEKLMTVLNNSNYKPTWRYRLDSIYTKKTVDVTYIKVPYTFFPDSLFSVSEEEMEQYASNQKEKYIINKTKKKFDYILFPIHATSKDSLQILSIVQKGKEELKNNDNDALTARKYNSEQINNTFRKPKDLKIKNIKKITSLKKGNVSDVFFEDKAFFVLKNRDIRRMPDSVFCRHILVAKVDPETGAQKRTDSGCKVAIDSIMRKIRKGENFSALARTFSEDAGSKDRGGEYIFSYLQYPSLAKEFAEYVFFQKPGSMSIIKTDFGYHIIQVLSHLSPSLKYKTLVIKKTLAPSQKTYDSIGQIAINFSTKVKREGNFKKLAQEENLNVLASENYDEDKFIIDGVPFDRSFTRWLDEANQVNKLSPLITLDEHYILANITEIKEKQTLEIASNKEEITKAILHQKKVKKIFNMVKDENSIEEVMKTFDQNINRIKSFNLQHSNSAGGIIDPYFQYAVFGDEKENSTLQVIGGNLGVYVYQIDTSYKDLAKSFQPNINPFELYFERNAIQNSFSEYLHQSLEIEDKIKSFY